MKLARKPTKPELTELTHFIFYEDLEEAVLSGWWTLLLPDLALLLRRVTAIRTVKRATISIFDDCWMQGMGYVDRIMTVRWSPEQMSNEAKDTFIWLNGRLEIMPQGTKFWQRILDTVTLENRGFLTSKDNIMPILKEAVAE